MFKTLFLPDFPGFFLFPPLFSRSEGMVFGRFHVRGVRVSKYGIRVTPLLTWWHAQTAAGNTILFPITTTTFQTCGEHVVDKDSFIVHLYASTS